MASTILKDLPRIRLEESVDMFREWLREIPCERHAFKFANDLLCKQYRSVIKRILHLKNLEQEYLSDGDTESAASCHYRSIEAKRRFFKLVRDSVALLSDDKELASDIVSDTEHLLSEVIVEHLLSEIINELRLMGE